MDQNDHEIGLLKNDPGKLLDLYQELIRIIVRKYQQLGYVAMRESEDMVQEVNHCLVERIGKIKEQYNGTSSLRTYFSVIIKNICREEFRKNPKVEEPQTPDYHKLEGSVEPIDVFLIHQEYQRFEKVLKLMFNDRPRYYIMLRYILDLIISSGHILEEFPGVKEDSLAEVVVLLNNQDEITKKEKFEKLSGVFEVLEGCYTSPDSLRKWFASRLKECLALMNGNPPRSAYSLESIQILIEKHEEKKIVD